MPGFTTKYNLYKPGGGSTGLITPDEVVDIDKLNSNFDVIDGALGAGSGTSGGRPASPKNGQIYVERDTGNVLVWDQTSTYWRPLNTPKANSASARNAFFPAAVQGDKCFRSDLGFEQQYFTAYDAVNNPGGRLTSGWQPAMGSNRGIIIPSSGNINSPGAAATIQESGWISFPSGATYLDIKRFVPVYAKRIVIHWQSFTPSGLSSVLLQMMNQATTHTGASDYNETRQYTSPSAVTIAGGGGSDHFSLSMSTPGRKWGTVTIDNMNDSTTACSIFAESSNENNSGSDTGTAIVSGKTNFNDSCDGFKIYVSAGTWSGRFFVEMFTL